jgi:hypothetical protein
MHSSEISPGQLHEAVLNSVAEHAAEKGRQMMCRAVHQAVDSSNIPHVMSDITSHTILKTIDAAAGGTMTTGHVSKGLFRTVLGNPLIALAVGAAAGYYGYKYRKEIAAAAMKATDMGKDFVLQQKENLSDLVEEAKEVEEGETEEAK